MTRLLINIDVDDVDRATTFYVDALELRVGRRLVIRPTWRRHRSAPDDVVLALDPGMAFGTGLHPTTRLCLAALESIADDGTLARQLHQRLRAARRVLQFARAAAAGGQHQRTDQHAGDHQHHQHLDQGETRSTLARAGATPERVAGGTAFHSPQLPMSAFSPSPPGAPSAP